MMVSSAHEWHDLYDSVSELSAGHVTDGIMGNSAVMVSVDALAVAIGTAHGVYTAKPNLDFNLLRRINGLSWVPLVLHGGSGTPDDDIKQAVELGIC